MDIIKKEYTNPRPVLYLYRGMPETTLVSNDFNTAKEITINTSMNEVATMTFSIPFTIDRKISYDDCEKLVKFENEYYIIKSIDIEDSTTGSIKVTCQHESTELKGIYCTYMDLIGASPQQMFDKIMASTMHPVDTGYKWGGTDVPATKLRHLITDDEASVYENLVSMAEIFNGWLEIYTDVNEIRWVYLRTQAINNGKFIKKNIDMKTLNITYSSEEIFTRLYPLGATDLVSGEEVNIMGVNPTGKSYIENYTWYLAKGIPASVVDKQAKYQQLKIMREGDYADPKALYDYAVEELAKCSVPQLEASLDMDDLSIYIDSLDEPPKVGYEITCINQDIDFILGCRITAVERNYDNPVETRVTISNFIRYDTVYQNIEHTAKNSDKVTTQTPDGTYVPASKVLTGDHVNVQMALNNHTSLITQTADKIALTVEDLNKAKAEIVVQAGQIKSTVEELGVAKSSITQQAGQITSLVTSVSGAWSQINQTATNVSSLVTSVNGAWTKINQSATDISLLATGLDGATGRINVMAGEINSKVDEGDFGSLIEQHPSNVRVSFNKISNYAEIDSSNGLILGDKDSGTYSKIGYDGRMEFMMNGSATPYRSLMYVGSRRITCLEEVDYTNDSSPLPPMFDGIPDSQICCMVSIKKIYDSNLSGGLNMPYWFGAYGSISGGYLELEVMSAWRKVIYDGNDDSDWVANFGTPRAGRIDVAFTLIA